MALQRPSLLSLSLKHSIKGSGLSMCDEVLDEMRGYFLAIEQ
jgi:hypothetical protein